jgi:hypothetical protein
MAKEYVVKKITQRLRLAEDGMAEKFYTFEILSAGGTYFSIDLTEAQTDPKVAAGIFQAKAKQLDAIREL